MALKQPEKELTFKDICDELVELQNSKGQGYKNSPMNILPPEYWLSQIVIKAMRAEQSTNVDKTIEELKDNIVYSVLMILRLKGIHV